MITSSSPCIDFLFQAFEIFEPSVRAFHVHNIDLYLCNIQPTGMLWGIMDFVPLQYAGCLFFPKCLLERGCKMSVKIVKDYVELPGLRISIKNLFHKHGEILLCPPYRNVGYPLSSFWFDSDKYVCCTISYVCVIVFLTGTWFHGYVFSLV